jgi:quercetin dioxygenase-like cupin family protein
MSPRAKASYERLTMSTAATHVAYAATMRFAMHETESTDGRLFDAERGCVLFSQRVISVSGERPALDSDEVLYVLAGAGRARIDGAGHELSPGAALFVARGTPWALEGEVRALSVLVHDPPESSATHAVVSLAAAQKGAATSGRQFMLGAAPHVGCESVTQFIGLVPPGRAPDHFHTYDEVIYVLEGKGTLFVDGEQAQLRAGTSVHLPARLVHCVANTGDSDLRLLGVFRPAGSPAEAYYPDGTPAVVPDKE